ncbi:hypothetical protein EZV62_014243 [Acer yangbiense]|uniref:RNase H type-1 domain-containing protein n=1 Tax=Acer yangbiense TaxID=1000413 RepID=A0A5C7HRR6_9ROSI|nr:hypothetical protein EZV62_014243 [Acer yangbiense]
MDNGGTNGFFQDCLEILYVNILKESVPGASVAVAMARLPASGCKVNVDDAVDVFGSVSSVGTVARNDSGNLLWATAKIFRGCVNVEVAEALAILEGLKLTDSDSKCPVLVESNALNVVNICRGLSISRTEADNVVQDIKDFLDNHGNFEVQFAPRNCNKATHEVAKWALSGFRSVDSFDVNNSVLWSSFFPGWLCTLIKDDVVSTFA